VVLLFRRPQHTHAVWLEDFDATELVSELTSISSDSPKFSISQSYFFLYLSCLSR